MRLHPKPPKPLCKEVSRVIALEVTNFCECVGPSLRQSPLAYYRPSNTRVRGSLMQGSLVFLKHRFFVAGVTFNFCGVSCSDVNPKTSILPHGASWNSCALGHLSANTRFSVGCIWASQAKSSNRRCWELPMPRTASGLRFMGFRVLGMRWRLASLGLSFLPPSDSS